MDVVLDFTEVTEEDLGGLFKSTGWFKEKRKLTGILKDGPVGFVLASSVGRGAAQQPPPPPGYL